MSFTCSRVAKLVGRSTYVISHKMLSASCRRKGKKRVKKNSTKNREPISIPWNHSFRIVSSSMCASLFEVVVTAKAFYLLFNKLKPKLMARVVHMLTLGAFYVYSTLTFHVVVQISAYALTCNPLRYTQWLNQPTVQRIVQFCCFACCSSKANDHRYESSI